MFPKFLLQKSKILPFSLPSTTYFYEITSCTLRNQDKPTIFIYTDPLVLLVTLVSDAKLRSIKKIKKQEYALEKNIIIFQLQKNIKSVENLENTEKQKEKATVSGP